MLNSFRRFWRPAWKPLKFPETCSHPFTASIEEEKLPGYKASRYYPVRLGDIFQDRYQVVGKLGFGASSTVWLARDLSHRRHVALKLYIDSASMGDQVDNEIHMYKLIQAGSRRHPGYDAVRILLDSFHVNGSTGTHQCLVHTPLFESVLAFRGRNPVGKLPVPIIAFVLKRLFLALDFLHTECRIIHTDLKADNIMFSIDDDGVFSDYEQQELANPSPRKETDGRTIYCSRKLRMPKAMGAPVLCDFGSAVLGDEKHTEDVQPNVYRAPEVIPQVPWSYEIDIWNAGCMVWDMFEGHHLFTGWDPEHDAYRIRAHVSEMISLLGPPSQHLLSKGELTPKFFSDDGKFSGGIPIPDPVALGDIVTDLEGEDKAQFLRLMHKMLQWDADKHSSAKALVEDQWIAAHTKLS